MDSDDFAALMEEEVEVDVEEEVHLMILAVLAILFAKNAKPRRGGSKPGRRKCKNRHRMEGYCMLYADYFADAPLHDEKVFRRCYRMSRKLFLRIVIPSGSSTAISFARRIAPEKLDSPHSRSARWL